jgi:hypothetical protein
MHRLLLQLAGNGTMLMGLINGESPCVHDEVYPVSSSIISGFYRYEG